MSHPSTGEVYWCRNQFNRNPNQLLTLDHVSAANAERFHGTLVRLPDEGELNEQAHPDR
jgi:hypothetical protein